jgi:hypothetical protein
MKASDRKFVETAADCDSVTQRGRWIVYYNENGDLEGR